MCSFKLYTIRRRNRIWQKFLFLAQFAPTNGKKVIPLSAEEKFYAETYHLPICDILE